jgi:signal transduction histidine kinase
MVPTLGKPKQPVVLQTSRPDRTLRVYPVAGFLAGAIFGLAVAGPLPAFFRQVYGLLCFRQSLSFGRLIASDFTWDRWPVFTAYFLALGIIGAFLGNTLRRLKENRARLKNLSHEFEIQVATLRHHYKNLTLGIDGFARRIKSKLAILEGEFQKCADDHCPTYPNFHQVMETLKNNTVILEQAAKRLSDTLGQELRFLRALTSDSLELVPGNFYSFLVQAVRDLLELRFRDKDIRVEINGQPFQAFHDTLVFPFEPYSMEVILQNILSNSMKYGDYIQVGVEKADKWIKAVVKDNGPGLDLDKLQKRLLSPADCQSLESTHLGLKVTLHLLAKCQGRLSAMSLPGEGAVFIMEFPVGAAAKVK